MNNDGILPTLTPDEEIIVDELYDYYAGSQGTVTVLFHTDKTILLRTSSGGEFTVPRVAFRKTYRRHVEQ